MNVAKTFSFLIRQDDASFFEAPPVSEESDLASFFWEADE